MSIHSVRCGMCRNVIPENDPRCLVVNSAWLENKPLLSYGAVSVGGVLVSVFCETCGDNGVPEELQIWTLSEPTPVEGRGALSDGK